MKSLKIAVLLALMLPLLVLAANRDKAQIITGFDRASQCISPIHVNQIDGREAQVQPMGFELEPGTHNLKGKAIINTSICQKFGRSSGRYKIEPLEADFEAGKTYYIGYDHNSPNQNDWKLVIWKVEDQKG